MMSENNTKLELQTKLKTLLENPRSISVIDEQSNLFEDFTITGPWKDS